MQEVCQEIPTYNLQLHKSPQMISSPPPKSQTQNLERRYAVLIVELKVLETRKMTMSPEVDQGPQVAPAVDIALREIQL